MLRALDEFEIGGVKTLLGFHRALLRHPCFERGETCHGLVESELLSQQAEQFAHETTVAAAADGGGRARVTLIEVDGRRHEVRLVRPEPAWSELGRRRRERLASGGVGGGGAEAVVSPMQGTVLAVEVEDGESVRAGQVLCIVEAMKMENEVHAHRNGVVSGLSVAVGTPVATGQTICVISAGDGAEDEPARP
jgi:acetyl-CoA/propionyl-CoA carboxylase biotin carboxyl carrier protein